MAWDFNNFSTYIINQSKFFGYYFDVTNLADVTSIINEVKKLHKKATHVCYAYKFYSNQQLHVKANDDNEPKGSAGYAIYHMIEKKKLDNCLIIVVRYFGKSKLGKANLLRSYMKASGLIIDAIQRKEHDDRK